MRLYQVDAFTQTAFAGNPAGVCLLPDQRPDEWMLNLAREMNLSETAFLLPQGAGYSLRWFTPKTEVSLCGHATLASAHILWEERLVPESESIQFYTKSGTLPVRRTAGLIEMDFPARKVVPTDDNVQINHALGVAPTFTGRYVAPNGDLYLLRVASDDIVKRIAPDFQELLATSARVVIVTSTSSDPTYDFVSRFFAPAIGINEDPVTGSAHCYLAPYWGAILQKTEMVAYQASGRTGVIRCTCMGERVWIGGNAKTIFRAELFA
jgi:PhzF family phenazine biosynthesis protein